MPREKKKAFVIGVTKSGVNPKCEKKLKYYPDLTVKDRYVTEFNAGHEGHSFDEKLDPDKINFTAPDFGFNEVLNFEEDETVGPDGEFLGFAGWKKFMDSVSLFPRCERV
jgi:hypothetical protein